MDKLQLTYEQVEGLYLGLLDRFRAYNRLRRQTRGSQSSFANFPRFVAAHTTLTRRKARTLLSIRRWLRNYRHGVAHGS